MRPPYPPVVLGKSVASSDSAVDTLLFYVKEHVTVKTRTLNNGGRCFVVEDNCGGIQTFVGIPAVCECVTCQLTKDKDSDCMLTVHKECGMCLADLILRPKSETWDNNAIAREKLFNLLVSM